MKKNILIIAGETSGDIHASNLIKNLKTLSAELSFFGIGGKRMLKEGVTLIEDIEKLSIIGVSEIFAKLKYIRRAYKKVIAFTEKTPPDVVILVDYPGFNLAIAKALKRKGLKIIYYITPQVWAWGESRICTIKKYVDKAIVILKFEEDLFKSHKIDATFVGHPLLDIAKVDVLPDKKSLGLDKERLVMALLPGSRESEIKRLLPVMLKTAKLISKEENFQFLLLQSSDVSEKVYEKILERSDLRPAIIKDNTYACLGLSDFVFTSSGTATLETAIMERPMLITYKTSFLTALFFKIFARTSLIGLVNIIAEREIVPEILQYDAKPKRLASEIIKIISSDDKIIEQIQNLRQVKHLLGTPGASLRAARIIERALHGND